MSGIFRKLDYDELDRYAALAKADVGQMKAAGVPADQLKPEREVLSEFSLAKRWSLEAYLLRESTAIIVGFNKRGTDPFGRYANVYVVHTRLAERGKGQAVEAYRAVMMLAAVRGAKRIVTTAGSYGGWRTHRALGLPAWGLNDKGQIITDGPVHPDLEVPGRPPRATQDQPMTPYEQVQVLIDPNGPYRVNPADLEGDWRKLA